jgi:TolA-binding protein
LAVALASFAFVGCATAPEEDPVYIRMNDLDARVQRIERVLTNQSLLELAQRIDALQADLRTIRGEVELLQNETQGGKTQSRNLYGDLEKRLAALETLGGVGECGGRWSRGSCGRCFRTGDLRCRNGGAAWRQLRQGNRLVSRSGH